MKIYFKKHRERFVYALISTKTNSFSMFFTSFLSRSFFEKGTNLLSNELIVLLELSNKFFFCKK